MLKGLESKALCLVQCYQGLSRQGATLVVERSPSWTDSQKDEFCGSLQIVLAYTPRRGFQILIGDLNAKLGLEGTDKERAA